MGTGEGAQVYGPGLYFAESEDVARGYRNSLSARAAPNDARGNAFDLVQRMGGDVDATIEIVRDGVENATSPNTQEFLSETLKHLEDGTYSDFERPLGRLYEVNIRAKPEDFLNWDAPISQQSEKVRETLMPFVEQRIAQMGEAGNRFTPEQWMDRLRGGDVMLLDKVGDTPVSRAMIEAGIPGVRYLDQASRGAGEGTRNIVVFDDQLIDIVKKYGVAGLAVGAAVQSELRIQDQIEDGA